MSRKAWIVGYLAAGLAALSAGAGPGRAQESFVTELKLGVDREKTDIRKLRPAELKTLEAVLKKRLPILALKEGSVHASGWDDIRVRVPADKLDPSQVRMFVLPGRLEIRALEDVQTELNPHGRYFLDVLSVQGNSTLRFRDRQTNLPVKPELFLPRCPLLVGDGDLEPDTAHRVGEGTSMAVRVRFTEAASRRLHRFTHKPGRLLAVTLDGEIVSMHAVSRTVKEAGKQAQKRGDKSAGTSDDELGTMDVGGGFTTDEEAGYLALVFNSGALSCPLLVRSTGIVTP